MDHSRGAGLNFCIISSWIDSPASAIAAVQLLHDLNLAEILPDGTRCTIWAEGETGTVNVNESGGVDAADVETVWVFAKNFTTDAQSRQLMGRHPGTGTGATSMSSSVSLAEWSASLGDRTNLPDFQRIADHSA